MKISKIQKNKGFTLVETMVAVFILTLSLSAFLTLTSRSLFTARYSRNEITANYLIQEAADFIRNQRDSTYLSGGTWQSFINKFGGAGGACFSNNGCYFDINSSSLSVSQCNVTATKGTTLKCPFFYYNKDSNNGTFYNYTNSSGAVSSNFKRQIKFSQGANPDELYIAINVEWLNGNLVRSRSLNMSLLNWYQ